MSFEATRAAWTLVGSLDEQLSVIDAKRRPSTNAARVVLLAVADAYREPRGYVSETQKQLSERTGLTPEIVKLSLRAFDCLGLTRVIRASAPGRAPHRVLGFHPNAVGSDPPPLDVDNDADHPNAVGSDPPPLDVDNDATQWGDGVNAVGYDANAVGSDPTPPHHLPQLTIPDAAEPTKHEALTQRMHNIAEEFAVIRLRTATGKIGDPTAFKNSARNKALEMPDCRRYAREYPTAPINVLANALNGDNHSLRYHERIEQGAA